MTTAIEFGKRHASCDVAMEWRRSLPEGATQADAYRVCERADWLVWQLTREPEVWAEVRDAVLPVVGAMVDSGVERHCLRCGVASVEEWARKWLDGSDRSTAAAEAATSTSWAAEAAWATTAATTAAAAAAWAAAAGVAWAAWAAADQSPEWHAEWREKIRAAVPEWPEVTK